MTGQLSDDGDTLVVSATQFETFELCPRKWALRYALGLREPDRSYLDFGTVLHSVCERFLKADDLGRDADGRVVDLYPDGWAGALPPVETDLIQKLVACGISEGLLVRLPGRLVEHAFLRPMAEGIACSGKIDLLLPDAVHDHKTTKNLRYAKSQNPGSPNYLGDNTQMLVYAHEVIERDPSLGVVGLQHNVYCKDPEAPSVRKVETAVSRAAVIERWDYLRTVAGRMAEVKEKHKDVSKWFEIQGPKDTSSACRAYGGCSYRLICGGRITPAVYRKELESMSDAMPKPPTKLSGINPPAVTEVLKYQWQHPVTEVLSPLLSFDEAKKAIAALGTDCAVGRQGDAAWKTAKDYDLWSPPVAAVPAPPWAVVGCVACFGKGFNSTGGPCRICDQLTSTPSHLFRITTEGDGKVSWSLREPEAPIEAAAPTPVLSPPKRGRPAKAPAPTPTAPASTPTAPAPTPTAPAPAPGFSLLLNCVPEWGGLNVIAFDIVLRRAQDTISKASSDKPFFSLDPFQRRDRLAGMADGVATELAGSWVVAAARGSQEHNALLEALRPLAAAIIVGHGG